MELIDLITDKMGSILIAIYFLVMAMEKEINRLLEKLNLVFHLKYFCTSLISVLSLISCVYCLLFSIYFLRAGIIFLIGMTISTVMLPMTKPSKNSLSMTGHEGTR